MEISSRPLNASLQVTLAGAPALVRVWQAGQVIEAAVVRVVPERKAVLLQLAEGEVEAQSELPLRPGMRLQLTAEPRGNQWQLRIIDAHPPVEETLAAALRQALPRATPLVPLFEAVERLLANPPADLPERIRVAAENLAQARPTPERLSKPDSLRTVLRDAGILLEARLAVPGEPPPKTDLKAHLLTLLAALAKPSAPPTTVSQPPPPPVPTSTAAASPDTTRGTPSAVGATTIQPVTTASESDVPRVAARNSSVTASDGRDLPSPDTSEWVDELLRKVEGALSRIQLHQLRALPDTQQEPQWIFELPVHTAERTETLLLRFEREGQRETGHGSAASGWRVTLDLSHPDHGALRAILSWRDAQISTHFFAARPATADLFRHHLADLGARLARAGIAVGAMEAHTGLPPDDARRSASGLLSERA